METNNKIEMTGFEFYNRSTAIKTLWIEPACIELELESQTEYRIEADDNEYRIEFIGETVIFYLQYKFGPKVYKRKFSNDFNNSNDWILEADYSDIN